MILNLITDRTSSDVAYIKSLQGKKWADLTETQKEEYLKGLKGAYSYIDFNRVIEAVNYLSDTLNTYGYSNAISKQNPTLTANSAPNVNYVQIYINNVAELKNKYYSNVAGTLPTTSNWLTIDGANYIEKLLKNINDILVYTEYNDIHAGVASSGQIRLWQQRFRRGDKWVHFNYALEKYNKTWNTVTGSTSQTTSLPIEVRDNVGATINSWNKEMNDLDTLIGEV